jgi:hypothetical protein
MQMENQEINRQYFSHSQLYNVYLGTKDLTLVCGRGYGKGALHAAWNLRNMQRMPGSITGIVAANVKRALTNTLPSMLIHWERWGYRRNVHWVIGKKPPKKLGFAKPLFVPENYENVISFYNGSLGFIISQDRAGTSNSFSFDAVDIDEAKFIDYNQLKNETLPANRGNAQYFGQHSFHHGVFISSDMPVTTQGSWFMNDREKCDPELISLIEGLVYERWRVENRIREAITAGKTYPEYLNKYLREVNINLERFRAAALYYHEYSSIENLQLLGETYIRRMKRDLPPLTFQTAILCKRIGIVANGFYSSMTEKHKYNSTDFAQLDNLEYDFKAIGRVGSLADGDVDPYRPLYSGWDYNANINWAVIGQPTDGKLRVLKSFYVTFERKLPELVDDICEYYKEHKRKEMVVYYDVTALASNYAVNDEDFLYVITKRFESHGWSVTQQHMGNPMKHMEKHLLINAMFAGQRRLMPMINVQNNEDLLICIQSTGVYNGHKDKRHEKDPDSEENPLRHRTDGSDAFDNLCIGCERFPQEFAAGYIVDTGSDFG